MSNKAQIWKVSPEQYAAMQSQVNAAGIAISGNSGAAEKSGVKAAWDYDGENLSVTVLSAPPFMTGVAERKIASAINKALEG